MTESDDLAVLQGAWRESRQAPSKDLCRIVIRQAWLLRIEVIASVAIAVVFLTASAWKAAVERSPEFLALAVGVWIGTIGALYYSVINWAGLWAPLGLTANHFLALSMERCQAGLRAITFGLWFLLIQVVFVSSWHAWYWSSRQPEPPLGTWLLAACLPVALLVWLLLRRARLRRELLRLEDMRRELNQ